VVRVDNYWCHSAIISTGNYSTPASAMAIKEEASDVVDSLKYTTNTTNTAISRGWGRLARIAAKKLQRNVHLDIGFGMGSRRRSATHSDRMVGVEVEFTFGKRNQGRISRPRFVRDADAESESKTLIGDEEDSTSPSPEGEDGAVRIPEGDKKAPDTPVRTKHHRKRSRMETSVGRPGMKFVTFFCDDQKVCCSHFYSSMIVN
jgi:hypothetical protein